MSIESLRNFDILHYSPGVKPPTFIERLKRPVLYALLLGASAWVGVKLLGSTLGFKGAINPINLR